MPERGAIKYDLGLISVLHCTAGQAAACNQWAVDSGLVEESSLERLLPVMKGEDQLHWVQIRCHRGGK